MPRGALAPGFAILWLVAGQLSPAVEFERTVIDDRFPGAYQVEVADVNGDGKPDIIAVGGGTCAWYENPKWTKRLVTDPQRTPGIISSATADLNGDGKAEIAIAYEFAMNEPKKGKLTLATQVEGGDWKLSPSDEIGSIHRLRWGDLDGDKALELVIAPLFGPEARPPTYDQDPARIRICRFRDEKTLASRHIHASNDGRPVIHAIEVLDTDGDGRSEILTADNLGVAIGGRSAPVGASGGLDLRPWRNLVGGAPGPAPKRGSSEVHLGRLRDGRRFLATVEPWHGSEVTVYQAAQPGELAFGPRTVIDNTLADGHALWVADVDGDGDQEIFAGHRGADHRVSVYDFDGKNWSRTVIDRAIAAQDLRGGDLDGDGAPDVVAVGGSTHNVVWYRPAKK